MVWMHQPGLVDLLEQIRGNYKAFVQTLCQIILIERSEHYCTSDWPLQTPEHTAVNLRKIKKKDNSGEKKTKKPKPNHGQILNNRIIIIIFFYIQKSHVMAVVVILWTRHLQLFALEICKHKTHRGR